MATRTIERRTYNIPEFAKQLGLSNAFAYAMAKSTGEIAGVPVIRVGSRLLIPRGPADRVLAGESTAQAS